jgi:hypothetical protein
MSFRNRPLIRLGAQYKKLLDEARADLSAMHFEYQCRAADRDREVAALRSELEGLKLVIRRRVVAEQELDRLRAIRDAATTERDFGARLH